MSDPQPVSQPPDPQSAPAPNPASNAAGGSDMLTQSEWTRRLVAVASVIVVGLSILAIVAVMCYRVVQDGNSTLTNDITTKLMLVAMMGIGAMIAALFGSNNLIAKAIDKLVP